MSPPHEADLTQIRLMAEQVADLALKRFALDHPEIKNKMDIPAPLKWAAAIVAGIMTAGVVALSFWVVSTLNALQITVVRIDERQQQVSEIGTRVSGLEDRVRRLEDGIRRHGSAAP